MTTSEAIDVAETLRHHPDTLSGGARLIPVQTAHGTFNVWTKRNGDNPRYMELLIPYHYEHHVLRLPHAQWPDPVHRSFAHLNPKVYIPLQGPSELGASGRRSHAGSDQTLMEAST